MSPAAGAGAAGFARSRDGTGIALFRMPDPAAPLLEEGRHRGSQVAAPRPIPPVAAVAARPPVLLVHGATADHTTWRVVGPMIAQSRPTYAIDRRGRGDSGDTLPYAIEREYEDVAAAAELISTDHGMPADVVGHSYGGRVALGATLLSPAIRRIVVYEGAPVPAGMSYRPPGMVEALRAALDRGDNETALATFLAGIVGMSEAALDAYRADAVWPARVAAAPTILREVEAEAGRAASLDALGAVTAPVLLVLGSISRSPFRIGTDELASRLADARVVTIEGAAHAAHHTHAGEFVQAVESFLDADSESVPATADAEV